MESTHSKACTIRLIRRKVGWIQRKSENFRIFQECGLIAFSCFSFTAPKFMTFRNLTWCKFKRDCCYPNRIVTDQAGTHCPGLSMQQPQLLHSLLCIPVDTRIYGLQSDPSVLLCTRPYETHGSLATDFFFPARFCILPRNVCCAIFMLLRWRGDRNTGWRTNYMKSIHHFIWVS